MDFKTIGDLSFPVHQVGARFFWLSMISHVITLPYRYGVGAEVGAISFACNGFKPTDVYIVPGSPWNYSTNTSSFYLAYSTDPMYSWYTNPVSGRFLYPGLVQMKNLTTMAVKSFSTSFIFQIFIDNTSLSSQSTGPGLAFLIVPDNYAIGANLDYMGLLTANTTETSKNYESDNHTLGVEFDTFQNLEFGDPNDNHVGLNLTSMNSSYVFVPSFKMASENAELMRQVWIDYDQNDFRMGIYNNQYGQGKPATPQGSTQGLDLSFLLQESYIGFSAGVGGTEGNNLHPILAWSFSNEGEAPPIWLQTDAPAPGSSSLRVPSPAPPGFSPALQEAPAGPPGRSVKHITVAVTSVGSVLIVTGICLFCWYIYRRGRSRTSNTPPKLLTSHVHLQQIPSKQLIPSEQQTSPDISPPVDQRSDPLRIFISHTGGPTGFHKNLQSPSLTP